MTKAVWRKSSYTTSNGGNCVELASLPDNVAVRGRAVHGADHALRTVVNRATVA
ncbi:MAG TPA: DUF397 domain-containing protein [Spirillospora sp.]|nr:DUF397 domain-containing protein [Spirillospora sp.]